jgi:CheY-like chemotaxis protein
VKILFCTESPLVAEAVRLALEPGGHQLVSARDPFALAASAAGAGALLVEPARARQAVALLRDRGFGGRALILTDGPPADLEKTVRESEADGVLALRPVEELPRRFAVAAGGRRKVLVVDDSELAARLLAEELRTAGFDARTAADAETATSLILKRATRPDLVLLDIHMPKVSGVQFCRFIKTNEMFRSIKVIFCSADRAEEVARLAQECGADGYVLKGALLGKWIVENT